MAAKLTVLDEARRRAEACGLDDPLCLHCIEFEPSDSDVGRCRIYGERQLQWGTCGCYWRWNGKGTDGKSFRFVPLD